MESTLTARQQYMSANLAGGKAEVNVLQDIEPEYIVGAFYVERSGKKVWHPNQEYRGPLNYVSHIPQEYRQVMQTPALPPVQHHVSGEFELKILPDRKKHLPQDILQTVKNGLAAFQERRTKLASLQNIFKNDNPQETFAKQKRLSAYVEAISYLEFDSRAKHELMNKYRNAYNEFKHGFVGWFDRIAKYIYRDGDHFRKVFHMSLLEAITKQIGYEDDKIGTCELLLTSSPEDISELQSSFVSELLKNFSPKTRNVIKKVITDLPEKERKNGNDSSTIVPTSGDEIKIPPVGVDLKM